jgi:hypothetical protein
VCTETEVGGEGVGREVGVFVETDVWRLDVDAVESADERVMDECDFSMPTSKPHRTISLLEQRF